MMAWKEPSWHLMQEDVTERMYAAQWLGHMKPNSKSVYIDKLGVFTMTARQWGSGLTLYDSDFIEVVWK